MVSEVPVLIVVHDVTGCLVVRAATRYERALVRLRTGSLDRRLATGDPPESDPLLALRAVVLVRPDMRLRFAQSLQQVMHEVVEPGRRRWPILSAVARENIRYATDALVTLVEGLLSPSPVSACGVARVKILLTDGAGPLYYPGSLNELRCAVQAAVDGLNAPMTS